MEQKTQKMTIVEALKGITGGEYKHEIQCYDDDELKNFIMDTGFDLINDGFSKEELMEFFTTIKILFTGNDAQDKHDLYNVDIKKEVEALFKEE